jgi:hypothetical protein
MRNLAEKLRGLEQALADEKGPFNLFALFLREGALGLWDVVVAAEWIGDEDQDQVLVELAKRVRAYLLPDEIMKISGVVIVDAENPDVKEIATAVPVNHGLSEVANRTFFGLEIKHGFVITAQINPPPKKVELRPAAAGGRR